MKRILAAAMAVCICGGALCACGQEAQPAPSPSPQPDASPETLVSYEVPGDIDPYTGLPRGENYPLGTRGAAVMINNVRAAWPQSGLNSADLVYEMVTESGITRLMAVYRNYSAMPTVGPIRSARDQHVQLMLPLQTLYAHIGGSTVAMEYLDRYKYTDRKSIDGKYKNFYWIDAERRKTKGQEHCVYTNGETFAAAVQQYGLESAAVNEPPPVFDFVRYTEPRRQLAGGAAAQVYLRFSSYADSTFTYDPGTGRYLKFQYDQPQIDMADEGRQYGADNLFLLFAAIEKYPDGVLAHVRFDQGQGAGVYFCGGRFERVRWMKADPASPLRIVDNEGHELDVKVNPGTSYVAVVGTEQIENCRIDGMPLEQAFNNAEHG